MSGRFIHVEGLLRVLSWVKAGHRPMAPAMSALLTVTLLATLAPTSAAAPDPVFPSAAEVAAAAGHLTRATVA